MKKKHEDEDSELKPLEPAEVLLYFRQAPIAEAVETQYKVNGIVESRRIEENFPDGK